MITLSHNLIISLVCDDLQSEIFAAMQFSCALSANDVLKVQDAEVALNFFTISVNFTYLL